MTKQEVWLLWQHEPWYDPDLLKISKYIKPVSTDKDHE